MIAVVPFLLTTAATLLVLFTSGKDLLGTFDRLTDSWQTLERRTERGAMTMINGPTGQWSGADSTVRVTLANTGDVSLGRFSDWDVIMEVQRSPGLSIFYLSYTTTKPVGPNEWTVDGIYRDASALTPETFGPGVFDPGEEIVVVAKPDPPVVVGTDDRVTFSTPNGITAKPMLEIVVTPTPGP